MANIGSFKKSGQEFVGEIVTLSVQTKGVRIVPQAENWIVERFGKFMKTLNPGLNLINPIFSLARNLY